MKPLLVVCYIFLCLVYHTQMSSELEATNEKQRKPSDYFDFFRELVRKNLNSAGNRTLFH